MIITFSNRKGGVGKSSLCITLANYLSMQNIPVQVIDVDSQNSLLSSRDKDLKLIGNKVTPKYDIKVFNHTNHTNKIPQYIKGLKESKYHVLFDTPGGMDSETFMQIVLFSDYVIVPFQYEAYSIDSTGKYARALKKLEELYPNLRREVIFVPNMVDTRIGKASDRKMWDEWDTRIEAVGNKAPRVPLRACLQRRNTLLLTSEELACVSPCFEYLTQMIFSEK